VGLASRDEAVGREILHFVHPESRDFVAGRLRELAQGGAPGSAEVRLARPTGEAVDVEMTSHAVTYQGQPAIQTIFWDVTARKQTEEQLRRAQKLDSVGRLAAGVAHDFNNMLLAIIGHAQLLIDGLHPSDVRLEHPTAIMAAAQRCGDLSRQLLAFSRRQLLDLHVVDLAEVVKRVESLFRGTLHADVQLRVLVPEAACFVKADVGQLEQVLINLAVNAQDAMPKGGTLTIAVTAPTPVPPPIAVDAPSGPCVQLAVTDTGCGMDASTREHAFEPFFTTKEPGRGTGLGLAMVHGIIKQHGGSIHLASEVGVGSTFTIVLPACAGATFVAPPAAEAAGPVGTETVLVVEDTSPVLTVTVNLLRRHGYTVLAAESARAALALLDDHRGPLDLLLTDVVMPDMSGADLAARVAARVPGVKVLYMSGHDRTVVADHGVPVEGALLDKPFSRHDLATRIRRLLDGA
jgi:signal transduction histidine kinase/CheY-like chemotaxis protein